MTQKIQQKITFCWLDTYFSNIALANSKMNTPNMSPEVKGYLQPNVIKNSWQTLTFRGDYVNSCESLSWKIGSKVTEVKGHLRWKKHLRSNFTGIPNGFPNPNTLSLPLLLRVVWSRGARTERNERSWKRLLSLKTVFAQIRNIVGITERYQTKLYPISKWDKCISLFIETKKR